MLVTVNVTLNGVTSPDEFQFDNCAYAHAVAAAAGDFAMVFTFTFSPVTPPAAPVAQDQAGTIAEDTPTAISLSATDPNGDALSFSVVVAPAHGTLSGTAPNLVYTPAPNFNGLDSFTFTASDGALTSAPARVSITVTSVNDPPTCSEGVSTTLEDGNVFRPLTSLCADVDAGDVLTYTKVTDAAHGTVLVTEDGLFFYTPALNFNGTDSFAFRVTDVAGATSGAAAFTLTILSVDDQPILVPIGGKTVSEGELLQFTVSATDADGDPFTFSATWSEITVGETTFDASTGTFSYTPAFDASSAYGERVFGARFTVSDAHGRSNSETINIRVIDVSPPAPPDPGATFVVNSTADAGDANRGDGVCAAVTGACTLRAAIQEANARPGGNTITLPAGTYALAIAGRNESFSETGDLDVHGDLIINGADAATTFVDGAGLDRLFHIHFSTVQMTRLTIRNGNDAGGDGPVVGGGGISNLNSILTLTDVIVTGNTTATSGGGIYSAGALTLENSTISNNQGGEGGGISSPGSAFVAIPRFVTIRNSTISGNSTTAFGGGISAGSTLMMDGSTVSGNSAFTGGGISAAGLTLTHSTVSGNRAVRGYGIALSGISTLSGSAVFGNSARADAPGFTRGFGAVHVSSGAGVTLTNSTVSGNSEGSGIYNDGTLTMTSVTISANSSPIANEGSGITNRGVLTARNAIVANNIGPAGNCGGPPGTGRAIASAGHNLDSGNTCGFASIGDLTNTDPRLGPLQDNGGATFTHALLAGSPAIDAGDPAGCPATDQRGVARPQGAACDIGAYETASSPPGPTPAPPIAASQTVTTAEDVAVGITLGATDPNGDVLSFNVVDPPTHGTLSGTAPHLTYQPAAQYHGPDSFTFRANDGSLDSNTATISLIVTAVNDSPVLSPVGNATVNEGQPLQLAVGAIDVDGDALTLSGSGLPTGSTFDPATGMFRYTPAFDVSSPGTNRVFDVLFTVSDGRGGMDAQNVRITVNDVTTAAPIRVSGGAYFLHDGYQEKMSLDVTVLAASVQPGSWLKSYHTRTRMNVSSTQILSAERVGQTMTITGIATLNGVTGYRFLAHVTDGAPDSFGITIHRPDGTLFYTYAQSIVGGDLIVQ